MKMNEFYLSATRENNHTKKILSERNKIQKIYILLFQLHKLQKQVTLHDGVRIQDTGYLCREERGQGLRSDLKGDSGLVAMFYLLTCIGVI